MSHSNLTRRIKRLGRTILTQPTVNQLVRGLLSIRLLRAPLPAATLNRIPVVGVVELKLWDGQTVRFYSDGADTIATRLYWQGVAAFEPATYELFAHMLPRSRCFVDIGANTGFYALIAGITDPTRRAYAFEPMPAICRYLRRNVEVNRLSNVTIAECAVTNYDGVIKLYVPGAVMLPTSASTLQGFRTAASELECRAVTLDNYLAQHAQTGVDLTKIDTEDTEHLVSAGAQRMLAESRPAIICEVLHGQAEHRLRAVLGDEYRAFLITDSGLIRREEIIADSTDLNYLFITSERLEWFGIAADR
jgi:FkbM family methyltransferase